MDNYFRRHTPKTNLGPFFSDGECVGHPKARGVGGVFRAWCYWCGKPNQNMNICGTSFVVFP